MGWELGALVALLSWAQGLRMTFWKSETLSLPPFDAVRGCLPWICLVRRGLWY